MRWGRKTGLVVFALAIVFAIVRGFQPQPVVVNVAYAERGPMRVTVEEEGKTRVIDRFIVSAPIAGFARRVEIDVGDPVKRGAVLVRLDPLRARVLDPRSRAEAKARVAAAQASLSAAQENVEVAATDERFRESELKRTRELFESGTIPKQNLDQAETDFRRAQATLRSAQFSVEVAGHELEVARTALRYSAAQQAGRPIETVAIHSPVSGRVLKLIHESEGVVQAGQALVEIGDPRGLEIEVEVLSADAVKIGPGTRTLLERWGGEKPLEAEVRTVEPVGFTKISALGVEEQRVLVIADIVSPPEEWERLGDGYRVEAQFVLWEEDEVLQIPGNTLFRRDEGWAVFVVEAGLAKRREVTLGRRNGLSAQVLSGIEQDEVLIAHPDKAIEEGVEVTPVDEGT